jgi:tetratricopeptide (TPR) repeat protein
MHDGGMNTMLPFFIGLFSTVPASTDFNKPDFGKLIEKARASVMAYDLNSAEQDYSQACPAEGAQSLLRSQVAFCEHGLGAVADLRGNSTEAVRHYLKALVGWESLGDEYLAHRITTLDSLGAAYRRQDRVPEAEKVLDQALGLARPLARSNPELYATVLSRRGALYGAAEPARAMLNEAIALLRAQKQPNARELASACNALGMVNLTAGRYKEGESNLRQAVEFAGASVGEDHPETQGYAGNLALALISEGEFDRAEVMLRRARFVIETRVGSDSLQLANVLTALTSAEGGLGKFNTAEDDGRKALAILKSHAADGASGYRGEMALVQVDLGALYLRQGKTNEAEELLPSAVDEERRLFKPGRRLADGLRILAVLRVRQQAWDHAETLYAEALGMYEAVLGPEHPDIAPMLREYAQVLKHERAPKGTIRSVEARARAIERAGSRA